MKDGYDGFRAKLVASMKHFDKTGMLTKETI